jgi:hypothetical protein
MSAPLTEEACLAIRNTASKIGETHRNVLQQTKKLLATYDSIPAGKLDDQAREIIERFFMQLVESKLHEKEIKKLCKKLQRTADVIHDNLTGPGFYPHRERRE